MAFQFEPSVVLETFPMLLRGLKYTVAITIGGLAVGFVLGAIAGLMKISRNGFFRNLAGIYIETIRGTPMLVQAMFLYYGVPMASGVRIPPLVAGIIVIAVNSGAYIAEIVRGAIQSINPGQMEAGRSIGLTRTQTMRYIIWPQAFRRMIPPLGNQFIISLKDTSLLMVIGVGELLRTGQEIVAVNFRAFEVYLAVGVVYLVMTLGIARALRALERHLRVVPGK
ncbi:MAG: polar amino acid transporter inner rane subunit [Desulfomicrobiaceae bacterium]|jgi:glutamine transport system permease protein|nr:amino acid ABC transporter permease [Desulfomicrobiaceae bacterium]MBZ4648218.1 polar amino acid transporter inner rane subunit [Desulfomicrobiaceae bacterium]MBZ4685366.1 polar amino acid transporter inner rane subunit [Desulfomicrobiaceae bacterium]MDK2873562.1 glutamine transport system permease protein [Desulfomicrobiaceae bacterium]HCF05658.1 nickel transporter [Desulfomicrobiaceae bacterium]